MAEEKNTGFTIKDKRSFDEHGNPVTAVPDESASAGKASGAAAEEKTADRQSALPPRLILHRLFSH